MATIIVQPSGTEIEIDPDDTVLAGLQKIAADGSKRFSSGMDMIGACCLLGKVNQATPLIEIGEGYATCETSRMATGFDTPVMVAFNAGNLLAVAQQLRRDFPSAHLLFLADDDARIVVRLREALLKDFEAEWEPMKAPWPEAGTVGSTGRGPTAQAASRAAVPAAVSRVRSFADIRRLPDAGQPKRDLRPSSHRGRADWCQRWSAARVPSPVPGAACPRSSDRRRRRPG